MDNFDLFSIPIPVRTEITVLHGNKCEDCPICRYSCSDVLWHAKCQKDELHIVYVIHNS